MKRERYYYLLTALFSAVFNLRRKAPRNFEGAIFITKYDELGDLMTAIPALREIRQGFPKAQISLLIKPYLKNLIEHLELADNYPEINEITDLKSSLVFDLRGDMRIFRKVLGQRPRRFYSRGHLRMKQRLKGEAHPHEVEANLRIIRNAGLSAVVPEHIGFEPSPRSLSNAALFLQRHVIEDFVIFHIGARKKLRRWHPSKFAELADYCRTKLGYDVVFVGSSDEAREIDELRETIPAKTYSFAGEGDLLDFAALSTKAKFFVGNESGPLQIASAVGTACIALFGPGEPHLFKPWGKEHVVLHHKLHCNPCDQVNCVYPSNPCINRIELKELKNAITQIEKQQGSA